ncbi:hypothetical protein WJX73_010122 [Symbiochloris irregularis]|uniref:Uncharacterized protein n=1 Tax=Symbiochloris irregularis TaxID=706552 RepID=A0AAW1PX55_9CHLO
MRSEYQKLQRPGRPGATFLVHTEDQASHEALRLVAEAYARWSRVSHERASFEGLNSRDASVVVPILPPQLMKANNPIAAAPSTSGVSEHMPSAETRMSMGAAAAIQTMNSAMLRGIALRIGMQIGGVLQVS